MHSLQDLSRPPARQERAASSRQLHELLWFVLWLVGRRRFVER